MERAAEAKKKMEISESELIHMIKQNKQDGRKFVGVPTAQMKER